MVFLRCLVRQHDIYQFLALADTRSPPTDALLDLTSDGPSSALYRNVTIAVTTFARRCQSGSGSSAR